MALQLTIPRLQTQARPTIWMPAVAVILFMAAYLPLATRTVHFSLPTTTTAHVLATTASNTHPTPATDPTSQATSATSPSQTCSPIGFPAPSDIALASQPVGLTALQDSSTTYKIFGNTASDLRKQIQQCAPGAHGTTTAEFTAETSYRLNWQYDVTTSSSGCSLTNVRVGLHTATVLPAWQAAASATPGLSGRWQSFIIALTTHEQGHADLDHQYANTLLDDLQSVQNTDCNTMRSLVNGVITQDVNALNAANDNYDTTTNHGATQGAILPTS